MSSSVQETAQKRDGRLLHMAAVAAGKLARKKVFSQATELQNGARCSVNVVTIAY